MASKLITRLLYKLGRPINLPPPRPITPIPSLPQSPGRPFNPEITPPPLHAPPRKQNPYTPPNLPPPPVKTPPKINQSTNTSNQASIPSKKPIVTPLKPPIEKSSANPIQASPAVEQSTVTTIKTSKATKQNAENLKQITTSLKQASETPVETPPLKVKQTTLKQKPPASYVSPMPEKLRSSEISVPQPPEPPPTHLHEYEPRRIYIEKLSDRPNYTEMKARYRSRAPLILKKSKDEKT